MRRITRLFVRAWQSESCLRIRDIIVYGQTEPVELLGVLLGLGFGTWLLIPGDTFHVSLAFQHMESLAPEPVWGLGILTLAVLCAVAAATGNRLWRELCALAHVCQWTAITYLFARSASLSTGVVVYGLAAVAAIWVSLRLGSLLPLPPRRRIPEPGEEVQLRGRT